MSRSPRFSSTRGCDLVNLCTVPLGFAAFSYILPRTPTQGHSAHCVPGHKHNPCKEEGGVVGSCEPLQMSWPSVAQGGLRLKSRSARSAVCRVPQLKGIIHIADTDDLSVFLTKLASGSRGQVPLTGRNTEPQAWPSRLWAVNLSCAQAISRPRHGI